MSITPFPSQGQYPWYDQLEQWGADTQAAAENAKVAADQVHADVAASVNAANQAALDAQAAQVAATNAAGLVGTPPDAAIAAAVASPASQTAAEMTSRYARVESVDPRHGDGLADATSHIQTVINAANALGAGVYVPAGTYKVSAPLEDVRLMHLAEGAKLTAAAPGMAAVVRSKASSRLDNGGIVGKGVIDANTNATFGIHLRNFLYFEVSGISVTGGVSAGIKLGDSSASGRSAEAILSNVRIINNSANIIPASRGIWGENSGDHSISQVLIQNYEIGMELPIAGNAMVHDVHAWAEPSKGVMKCGFLDRSNNSHYSLCHADTPSEYGWRLYGYQTTLAQSGVFINPAVGVDNTTVGVKFESPNPIASLVGCFFLGGGSGARLQSDIQAVDGNLGLVTVLSMVGQHATTTRGFNSRVTGLLSRDAVVSGTRMTANPATPTNATGFTIQTNGLDRWGLVADGAAETGSDAGTGIALRRFTDEGALAGDVFTVARGSGTWTWKTQQVLQDGCNIIPGSSTGTKFGTSPSQKLGFFGNTPVAKPAGLTAADNTEIDTGHAASDAAITNMRVRILQLETRLQLLGLLS